MKTSSRPMRATLVLDRAQLRLLRPEISRRDRSRMTVVRGRVTAERVRLDVAFSGSGRSVARATSLLRRLGAEVRLEEPVGASVAASGTVH